MINSDDIVSLNDVVDEVKGLENGSADLAIHDVSGNFLSFSSAHIGLIDASSIIGKPAFSTGTLLNGYTGVFNYRTNPDGFRELLLSLIVPDPIGSGDIGVVPTGYFSTNYNIPLTLVKPDFSTVTLVILTTGHIQVVGTVVPGDYIGGTCFYGVN